MIELETVCVEDEAVDSDNLKAVGYAALGILVVGTIVAAALLGAGIVIVPSVALSDVLSGLIALSSTAATYMAVAG